jgi:hypothetical protein
MPQQLSEMEQVVQRCKYFESRLEGELGASGRGLHEKVTSIQGQLPVPTVRRLRWIATLRNKLVHEHTFTKLEDPDGFQDACAFVEQQLDHMKRARETNATSRSHNRNAASATGVLETQARRSRRPKTRAWIGWAVLVGGIAIAAFLVWYYWESILFVLKFTAIAASVLVTLWLIGKASRK